MSARAPVHVSTVHLNGSSTDPEVGCVAVPKGLVKLFCLPQGRPDLKIQYVAAWLKRKGKRQPRGCGPRWGHGGKAAFGRTLTEGNTRKPAVLGIVPVRQGRRPSR